MIEVFKDIPGFEGMYQASNFGRIKGLKRSVKHHRGGMKILPEKILNCVRSHEYLVVRICINGKAKNFPIHRLVGFAFIENKENKPEINHINGIKTDNRVENLEWVTKSENRIHAIKKLNVNVRGTKIVAIKDDEIIGEYKSIREAAKEGYNASAISNVLGGRAKTHKNLIWKCN